MEVLSLIQGDKRSSQTPLFLVHAISGLALPFLHLDSLSVGGQRPVYGITSPLHCPGGREFKYPSSLKGLASLYLEVIRDVQLEGPYLLGGWSMGGMVAMYMAHILRDQDEQVCKVIMIDSANPEALPDFESAEERDDFVRVTLDRTLSTVVKLEAGEEEEEEEKEDDDDQEEQHEPATRPASHLLDDTEHQISSSSGCALRLTLIGSSSTSSSSASSVLDAQEAGYLTDDSGGDSGDEAQDMMRNIKTHIHHGLKLIAGVNKDNMSPAISGPPRRDFDVVLIKCTPAPHPVVGIRDHAAAQLIETVMREPNMCWDASQFRSFRSIPFSGDHDSAFQPQHIAELSSLLCAAIQGCD